MTKRKLFSIDSLYGGGVTGFANTLYLGFLILLGALPLVTLHTAVLAGVRVAAAESQGLVHLSFRSYFAQYRKILQSKSRGVLLSIGVLVLAFAGSIMALHPQAPRTMVWIVGSAAVITVSIYAMGMVASAADEGLLRVYERAIEAVQSNPIILLWSAVATALIVVFVLWIPPLSVVLSGPWVHAQLGIWAKFTTESEVFLSTAKRQSGVTQPRKVL